MGITVLTVALIAALLTSSTTAGSSFVPRGTLELVANDTDGDGFLFTPLGGTPLLEEFSANNQSRLSEVPGTAELTELIPVGRGSGGQLYVGLKDHRIGVRAQGEGNGTPAVQINGFAGTADDQKLTIALNGSDLGGAAATNGQIGLKMKFGATAKLQPLFEGAPVGSPTFVECTGGSGSDCGPDSDGDLKAGLVGDGLYLFDAVEISIDQPEDGAVSLVSSGLATTWFNIAEPVDYDLSVTKVVDDDTPVAGAPAVVTYEITVAYESGNAPAAGITVTDALPTGVTAAGTATASEGTYDGTDWRGIDLGPSVGDFATLTIPVTVDPDTGGTTITNTATVSDTRDDDVNDSASADITPVDGILSCVDGTNTASQNEGGLSSDFTRLSVDLDITLADFPDDIPPELLPDNKAGNVAADCGTLIPFNQDIGGGEITFEPENPDLVGIYRGELTFPAGTSGADFFLALKSDYGTGVKDLEPCPAGAVADAAGTRYEDAAAQLAGFFDEMGADGNYPQLPVGNVSCVVSYTTAAGGSEHWVVFLFFDPRYF